MTFCIQTAPLVRFKIEGTQTTENGTEAPFKFWLTAERAADNEALKSLEVDIAARREAGSATPITDVLVARIKGWSDIVDADRQPVPFGEDALRSMLNGNGMAMLVYLTYLRESGAKAKN